MANAVLFGFQDIEHLMSQRVAEVDVRLVQDAIDRTVAEHNRQIEALLALFSERTTEYKEMRLLPTAMRNQPLDDRGRARPVLSGGYYEVAYPLVASGNAFGETWKAAIKAKVEDVNRILGDILIGDIRWTRDHVLAALYLATAYTFTDLRRGALTIQPLANGDATTYLQLQGADVMATDDHITAQANAIGAGADDPYPALYTGLADHPENSGEVITLIATAQKAATIALADFHPIADPNIRRGVSADELVGSLGTPLPGKLIGYHEAGVWIGEWRHMPANYLVSTMTGGDRALKQREEPEAELQGFHKVADRNDYPWYEQQWRRECGFGVSNRVNASVHRVGNGSYVEPTGYESPMP